MKDVQKSPDHRGIGIQRVGVRRVFLPLLILTREGEHQRVMADISLACDLAHRERGTHMSRFMEILNGWSSKNLSSVQVREILEETCLRLETKRAQISVRFKYFIEKRAPVTGSAGFLDCDCLFSGIMDGDRFSFILGVQVPVQLVCPCSKEISRYGAHNQRATVDVRLEYYPGHFIWIEDLVESMEASGSSPVYPVIKREDEKFVTERAFENPRFVEDTLRILVEQFRKDSRIRWFQVECDSSESIHNHNAFSSQVEFNDGGEAEDGLIPLSRINQHAL